MLRERRLCDLFLWAKVWVGPRAHGFRRPCLWLPYYSIFDYCNWPQIKINLTKEIFFNLSWLYLVSPWYQRTPFIESRNNGWSMALYRYELDCWGFRLSTLWGTPQACNGPFGIQASILGPAQVDWISPKTWIKSLQFW